MIEYSSLFKVRLFLHKSFYLLQYWSKYNYVSVVLCLGEIVLSRLAQDHIVLTASIDFLGGSEDVLSTMLPHLSCNLPSCPILAKALPCFKQGKALSLL